MGKTNWDKVGYHTDFTLTTLKSLYSLCVYLEQKCRDLLSCVKTSQQGQQGLSLELESHRVGKAEVSLRTVSPVESLLLPVQMKEWPALLWLMNNYTFNTTSCPSCLFACLCVHNLKCLQALHSAVFGKNQSLSPHFQPFRTWHNQTSAVKVNS